MIRTILALLPLLASAQSYDLLIRNGRIVDGTGNPEFPGDVAVSAGKIVAVGPLRGATATRVIDAAGLVVSPGFFDIHNHSDYTLLTDGNGQSFIRQGVTTVVLGEGGSAAPAGGKQGLKPRSDWTDFKGYFSRLLRDGISPNVATYVGSSQIWTYVHGERPGPITPAELTEMRRLVRQAMQQGALGVASSLSGPPGAWIDTDTMVALCEEAAPFGGIYSTHIRNEGDGVFDSISEAIEIGRRARIPVDVIHLKIADHKLWGRMPEVIARLRDARASGQAVEAHVYPYRAGQNDLASIIPPWAHEGGAAALVARLRDPALRARLENEIENGIPGWYNHYTATGDWEGMQLAVISNPAYRQYQGKRMSDVIRAMKKPPVDALFELLIENGGSVRTVFFHHSEQDMQYALKQPFVSVGSDGAAIATEGLLAADHPHPRWYGTFPRLFGKYVREEKVLTLEEAVRKSTSANAAKVRVFDRGLIRPGNWADITVFDPARIIDKATFESPHQYPVGIEYVVVNGTVVLDKGKHNGSRPGAIVYGPGKAN